MFYLGSCLNIFSFLVLAMNSFLDALSIKLCSDIANSINPNISIKIFVIPPSLPSKSNHPNMVLLFKLTSFVN